MTDGLDAQESAGRDTRQECLYGQDKNDQGPKQGSGSGKRRGGRSREILIPGVLS